MSLTIDTQIGYMTQWFNEWSDLQRSDFLPIMIDTFGNKTYINGMVNNIEHLHFHDKPMSLFECRVKLFKEWLPLWSTDNKEHFLRKVREIDPHFGEKLTSELQNGVPHSETNGISNEEILED